jgi:DNA-binding transcriptional ArsR family regulator
MPAAPATPSPTRPRSKRSTAGRNAPLFKALANPLRERIMILLTERVASPSQIATILDEDLGTISHHVRELAAAKLIELVRHAKGKRGEMKLYKAVARPILDVDSFSRMPKLLRAVASVNVGQLIVGDLAESINEGSFDARPGRTMLRVPGIVDEEGWEQIEPLSRRYLEGIFEIMAQSSERLAKSGDEGIPVTAAALAFEVPAPAPTPLEPAQ